MRQGMTIEYSTTHDTPQTSPCTDPRTVTTADIKANMRDIYTSIVFQHLAARDNNLCE